MPAYLDAAVVRIQPYLARTPELRLRRGASWMITRATSETAVDGWIHDAGLADVARNPEAGHADGVIALTVPEDSAEADAERVLLYLRGQLPGAELQASWGTARTYLEFRHERSPAAQPLMSLPAAADFPLTETCASCRVDPCDRASRMCADCAGRDQAAGRRRARPAAPGEAATDDAQDALGTERIVLDAVRAALGRPLQPVAEMTGLAALGEESGNRNHVATVALDGNGMGGFFAALAAHGDTTLKQRISPEISAATRAALIAAAQGVTRPADAQLPVIPHVVGGDDVVVSVTADRAWQFTLAFIDYFTAAMSAVAERLALTGPLGRRLPTMSAGIVFSHVKFPYARAVQLAEQALRTAKRDTRGSDPAIAWLDVTVDGEALPAWRTTQTAGMLGHRAGDLAGLGAISPSGRQALARLLARGSEEEARAAALSWARRGGHDVVPALLDQVSTRELRNLTALTRWWRR
jgi:hypothetical protein